MMNHGVLDDIQEKCHKPTLVEGGWVGISSDTLSAKVLPSDDVSLQ